MGLVNNTQRAWAQGCRGEKKRGSVRWENERQRDEWGERGVRSTSFPAARGVPAMLTRYHPSHFAKTEAVWREGRLRPGSNAANVILFECRGFLFDMMPMSAARNQKHTTPGVSQRDSKKRESLFLQIHVPSPKPLSAFYSWNKSHRGNSPTLNIFSRLKTIGWSEKQ